MTAPIWLNVRALTWADFRRLCVAAVRNEMDAELRRIAAQQQPPQAPARGDVGKFIAEARAAIVRLETGRPEWSPTADLLERLAAALAAAQRTSSPVEPSYQEAAEWVNRRSAPLTAAQPPARPTAPSAAAIEAVAALLKRYETSCDYPVDLGSYGHRGDLAEWLVGQGVHVGPPPPPETP